MKKKLSAPLTAAIGAGVFVVLLALAYLLASGLLHERDTGIVLSNGVEDAPVVSSGSQLLTIQSVADIEIGRENAQKAIASLVRPHTYSCSIENKLYYTGGSTAMHCRQYVRDDMIRTDTLDQQGKVKSSLLRKKNAFYAWNVGDTKAYQGQWGDFTNDAAAMLPSYEDVLGEEIELINAGRQDVEFDPCIYVEFYQGGFRCVYMVSAASGLLKSASFYDNDTLVRQVTMSELKNEAPEDTLFVVPGEYAILGE